MPIRKKQHPIFSWLEEPSYAVPSVAGWKSDRRGFGYRQEFGAAVPDAIAYMAAQGLGEPGAQKVTFGSMLWALTWKQASPFAVRLAGQPVYGSGGLQDPYDLSVIVPGTQRPAVFRLTPQKAISRYERVAWALGAPVEPTGDAWVQPRAFLRRLGGRVPLPAGVAIDWLTRACGEMRAAQLNEGTDAPMYVVGFYGCPAVSLERLRGAVNLTSLFGMVRGANGGVFVAVKV